MTTFTFLGECLLLHFPLFLLCLLISGVIYGYIIKKTVQSIIDPLLFPLFSAIFANAIPLFLFLLEEVTIELFGYFIISELIFWIVYFYFRTTKIKFSTHQIVSNKPFIGIYYLFFFIGTFLQILTYILFGIPIFLTSRLELYQNAGGLGLFSYIISFSQFYCILFSYYLIGEKKQVGLARCVLITFLFFSVLSGSKGSILVFIACFFFYKTYYLQQSFSIKKYKKYIIPIIMFPILIIALQSGAGIGNAFISFINRFIANGDCFWMAYPYNTIDNVEINNQFSYLFSRILGPFRLMNYSNMETNIGVQLDWLVYPDDEGIIKGPNTRLPILGWVLFRWKGLVLSAIFGYICAFWHTRLLHFFPKGLISVIFFGYIYTNMCGMFVDPIYSTSFIFHIVLFITIVYTLYLIVGGRFIRYRVEDIKRKYRNGKLV